MIMESLRDRARNRWRAILPLMGIDSKFLSRKNGPCPMCGGKTKFRFTDKDGDGLWICNDCGGGAGPDLVMKFRGVKFREAARMIEEVIGRAQKDEPIQEKSKAELRAAMATVWASGRQISRDGPVDRYLSGRGIKIASIMGMREASSGPWPLMLAKVFGPDGKPVNVHRTFLKPEGHERFMMAGETPLGSAIRLAPASETMGVAEGIETALSARDLFDVPVWALINANNLEAFTPPEMVKRVMIFADADRNGHGQKSAWVLCWRLRRAGIAASVHIPVEEGTDWNDVLRAGGGSRDPAPDQAMSRSPVHQTETA